MKATNLELPGVILFEPKVFSDNRGFFFESFNHKVFEDAVGEKINFVQDNHSYSTKGVLRGLHYQIAPHAQGKLVRIISGEVFDVAVDVRDGSPTFGKWVGVNLSAENKRQLWIPAGFAHGFLTLSHSAEMLYKTTEYYAPSCDRSIIWNDPTINIQWPGSVAKESFIISDKDLLGNTLLV